MSRFPDNRPQKGEAQTGGKLRVFIQIHLTLLLYVNDKIDMAN